MHFLAAGALSALPPSPSLQASSSIPPPLCAGVGNVYSELTSPPRRGSLRPFGIHHTSGQVEPLRDAHRSGTGAFGLGSRYRMPHGGRPARSARSVGRAAASTRLGRLA